MADDQNWKTVGPDRRDPDYKEAQRVVDEHYDQGPNYSSPEASMTNPDTYITPDGSRVEPADNNGNNFLYSREQDGETVYQNIVFGDDGIEDSAFGSMFDDTFVLAQNYDSKASFGEKSFEVMSVQGRGGHDRVIIQGSLNDYNIVPAEFSEMPGGDFNDPTQAIVLQLKEPNENGLKRIVISSVEEIIFAGDTNVEEAVFANRKERTEGLRGEINTAKDEERALRGEEGHAEAEARLEDLRGQRAPNPVDLEKYLDDAQPERVSFDDLREQMLNNLSPDQRGAYGMMLDVRDTFETRSNMLKSLNYLKNTIEEGPDRIAGYQNEVTELEARIAESKAIIEDEATSDEVRREQEYQLGRNEQNLERRQESLSAAQERFETAQEDYPREYAIATGQVPGENTIRTEREDGSFNEIVIDPPLTPEELALIEDGDFSLNDFESLAEIVTEQQIPGWSEIKVPTFRDGPQETSNLDPAPDISPVPLARPDFPVNP